MALLRRPHLSESPSNRKAISISPQVSYLQVLPDTNIFIEMAKNQLTLDDDLNRLLSRSFEVFLHPFVLKELEQLILQASTQKKPLFRLAKQLAIQYPLIKQSSDVQRFSTADQALLYYAQQDLSPEIQGVIVITNDQYLRQRLREQGLIVIYFRQRSHLELDGYLP